MLSKENLPPQLATPPISRLSPSHKPALGRQRDHSGCRVGDTPLKVKKTRENLKQVDTYAAVPPPCSHVPHAEDAVPYTPAPATGLPNASHAALREILHTQPRSPAILDVQPKIARQKSVSRRMLSRVKQGITSASKSSQAIRATGSDTSLARRISGRRKTSNDVDGRAHSFELSRDSIESTIEEGSGISRDTPPPVQRSFTDSTVSTSEILEDLASLRVPGSQAAPPGHATETISGTIRSSSSPVPSTPSPQPTPRPSRKDANAEHSSSTSVSVAVPCVHLRVDLDTASVDVNSKRDVWIAITATVQLKSTTLRNHSGSHNEELHNYGSIRSLRICYKPAEGCRIRNIIGQKSCRDVSVGQQCMLFIKIRVSRLQNQIEDAGTDQDSLFAELESIVGTLEMDILHVEARYRHSLFPADNIIALKHTCKMLRPKTESRWSIIGFYEKDDTSTQTHALLARYLADHYAAAEALELLHRYFDFDTRGKPGLAEVCSMLQGKLNLQRSSLGDRQPEVVITDSDHPVGGALDVLHDRSDTAPGTPRGEKDITMLDAEITSMQSASPSFPRPSTLAPSPIPGPRSMPPVTTATVSSSSPRIEETSESHDSAHQLWRHIRRTSLSARQLEEMTPDRLSQLEAGDDSLRELRRRAIANKRSIGAETLRVWKWEEDMQAKERPAEAPWM